MKKYVVAVIIALALNPLLGKTVYAEDGGIWIPLANVSIGKTVTVSIISSTSVKISWENSTMSFDKIIYGEQKDSLLLTDQEACSDSSANPKYHCQQLIALKPNTTYFYKIPTENEFGGIMRAVGGWFTTPSAVGAGGVVSPIIVQARPGDDEQVSIGGKPFVHASSTVATTTEKYIDTREPVSISKKPSVEARSAAATTSSMSVRVNQNVFARFWNFITSLF
jgi:hypothetical protein